MRDLIVWYNQTIREHAWPLLVATEFVFRFLAIHPFQDGNVGQRVVQHLQEKRREPLELVEPGVRVEPAAGGLVQDSVVKRAMPFDLTVDRDEPAAHLTVRWKGGLLTDVAVPLPRSRPATIRTDEATLDLVRRLATLYPDTVIAGILNRQGRTTARGHRFEANRVAHLRNHWGIPCFQRKPGTAEGEVMTIAAAAAVLNVAPSTLHRWLNDGLIAGEQVTPGAPWRIRMTDELKARFTASEGEGFITMQEATRALGVTRQTVLQRVKRGEIEAAHVTNGGKTGLRIKLPDRQPSLFEPA